MKPFSWHAFYMRLEARMWHFIIPLMRKSSFVRTIVRVAGGGVLQAAFVFDNAHIVRVYLPVVTGGAMLAYLFGYLLAH
ncbi:MAG: hypothetical protein Fur0018_06260 [Anaerolineales bacterium]